MRTLSKQRLQKMHAMLDKELEREDEGLSSALQKQKHKGEFSYLRYTGNKAMESQQMEPQKLHRDSIQKPSLFRRSLQKSFKQKQPIIESKKNLSSSQQQSFEQKQLKASLKGSRKNEINELEKKLLDLQKKMQNIGVSSSDDEEKEKGKQQMNNRDNRRLNVLSKQQSKKSLKTLMLRQNTYQFSSKQKEIVVESKRTDDDTARFSSGVIKIQQQLLNKPQRPDIKSSIPLSHRNNTKSQSSDEEYSTRYQKFVKVSRGSQKVLENREFKQDKKKEQSSEEEDSSNQIQGSKFRNKSITEEIQRLSIMKKQAASGVGQYKHPKDNYNNNKNNTNININNKPPIQNNQIIRQKQPKTKLHTLQNVPDRKQPLVIDHETLQPKYSLQRRNRSKSQSKKTLPTGKMSLSKESKEKAIETKKSQRKLEQKQKQRSGSSMRKITSNLDTSFRSDNSAKSKKSVNSLRSIKSNKSHTSNNNHLPNIKQLQSVQQKKYLKRISNLQKQLQHYKRLAKKQEGELSTYKLMEMQYRKLQIQFKKSQQIRIQQKKIIQNFRSRMINNNL